MSFRSNIPDSVDGFDWVVTELFVRTSVSSFDSPTSIQLSVSVISVRIGVVESSDDTVGWRTTVSYLFTWTTSSVVWDDEIRFSAFDACSVDWSALISGVGILLRWEIKLSKLVFSFNDVSSVKRERVSSIATRTRSGSSDWIALKKTIKNFLI